MKLPQISGKDLVKVFNKFGFKVIRQRGSHVQLEKIDNNETIVKDISLSLISQ